jgi:hypothetical protein
MPRSSIQQYTTQVVVTSTDNSIMIEKDDSSPVHQEALHRSAERGEMATDKYEL